MHTFTLCLSAIVSLDCYLKIKFQLTFFLPLLLLYKWTCYLDLEVRAQDPQEPIKMRFNISWSAETAKDSHLVLKYFSNQQHSQTLLNKYLKIKQIQLLI